MLAISRSGVGRRICCTESTGEREHTEGLGIECGAGEADPIVVGYICVQNTLAEGGPSLLMSLRISEVDQSVIFQHELVGCLPGYQ